MKQSPFKRLLSSIRQAVSYSKGEHVDGLVEHKYLVRQVGDRQILIPVHDGEIDSIPIIRPNQKVTIDRT